MVKTKFGLWVLQASFFFLSITTFAQKDTSKYSFLDSINLDDLFKLRERESYFKFQASYLTNSVYAGRKDTIALPYFTPSIEYNHKSGLYLGASISYLANSNSRIDLWSLDAGYNFNIAKKLSASVYAAKPFYNSNSRNVQSDVNFYTGGTLSYETKFLNISATGNIMFGSENDFSLIITLDHQFSWDGKKDANWTISPMLNTYLGSVGFYQNYKFQRINPQNNLPQTVNVTISSPNQFQVLSYEFSLPIYFDKTKWGIFLNPTFAIPVNPVVTTYKATGPFGGVIIPETKITENISNTLFAEFGVYYKF